MFKVNIFRGLTLPRSRLGQTLSISQARYNQLSNNKESIASLPTDKIPKANDLSQWEVLQLDPRGAYPSFANFYLEPQYISRYPPRGYAAEEIMQSEGAKDVFKSEEEVRNLITKREEHGDLSKWEVLQLDPRGRLPCFTNSHLEPEYASYNPSLAYTAEEIMQFQGAKDVFESVEEVRKIIANRDAKGTLEISSSRCF